MATFDNVVSTLANFKGYTGNPPTTEAEYLAFDCWKDSSAAPSWASVSADMALEEIRIKRQEEYPSVQECVHAILDDTLDALQAKRASVKLKYPKGG